MPSGNRTNLSASVALIGLGMITCAIALNPRINKSEAFLLAGSGVMAASVGIYSGKNATAKEWESTIDGLLVEFPREVFQGIARLKISKRSKQITRIILKHLPEPLNQISEQMDGQELFRKFLQFPHNRIVGPTGSGKTFLLCALLVQWLQDNPDGIVTICDINYGKPDRTTGEIFDWLGMPLAAIRYSEAEIFQSLKSEVQTLSTRKELCRLAAISKQPAPKMQPRLFIVSELDGTAKFLNDDKGKRGDFSQGILEILKQGNGYNMKLILEGQSLAVEESDLSESSRSQVAIAMLGTDTYNAKKVGQFSTPNADELVAKSSQLKSQKKRPCIIQLGDGLPQVIAVPDLSAQRQTQIEYCPDPNSPAGKWKAIRESIPDLEEKLTAIAQQLNSGELIAPQGSGGPIKAFILPAMSLRPADLSSEVWHKYGKPFWNQIKEKVQ